MAQSAPRSPAARPRVSSQPIRNEALLPCCHHPLHPPQQLLSKSPVERCQQWNCQLAITRADCAATDAKKHSGTPWISSQPMGYQALLPCCHCSLYYPKQLLRHRVIRCAQHIAKFKAQTLQIPCIFRGRPMKGTCYGGGRSRLEAMLPDSARLLIRLSCTTILTTI